MRLWSSSSALSLADSFCSAWRLCSSRRRRLSALRALASAASAFSLASASWLVSWVLRALARLSLRCACITCSAAALSPVRSRARCARIALSASPAVEGATALLRETSDAVSPARELVSLAASGEPPPSAAATGAPDEDDAPAPAPAPAPCASSSAPSPFAAASLSSRVMVRNADCASCICLLSFSASLCAVEASSVAAARAERASSSLCCRRASSCSAVDAPADSSIATCALLALSSALSRLTSETSTALSSLYWRRAADEVAWSAASSAASSARPSTCAIRPGRSACDIVSRRSASSRRVDSSSRAIRVVAMRSSAEASEARSWRSSATEPCWPA